jgi:hypothetical protein
LNVENRPHHHKTAHHGDDWRSRIHHWLHHGRALRALAYVRRLRIRAHHVKRATLVTAGLIGLIVLFLLGVAVRFAMGPVPLGAFSDRLHAAMNNALPGVGVTYEDAALEWSREEGRFNLIILGARVLDDRRHIIAQAPKAEIGLAAMPLLRGEVQIRRINLVGVQLTLVRDAAGVLHLGVEGNKSQGDILQRIRNAIEKSGNGPSTLDSFGVSKARLAFYDEASGLFIVAPRTRLEVKHETTPDSPAEAILDADIEVTGEPAHVIGTFRFPKQGGLAGDVGVTGLKLRALANNSKTFAVLAPFDLQTNISGSFVMAPGTKLRSADLGLDASGTIGGLGSPLKVKSFRFVGRYDAVTGRILIDDASLESEGAKAHFQGISNLSFAADGSWAGATLDLTGDQIFVGLPSTFQKSLTMGHIGLRGSYAAASRTFTLQRFGLDAPGVTGEWSGKVVLVDNASPEIDLTGTVAQMSVRDLVRYWPLKIGGGARNWIDANMPAGKLGPFSMSINLKPGALTGANGLPDDALTLTFPIAGASVSYVHGLTPMTNASGTGTLTGDTFRANIASARVGPLQIGKSQVTIPKLHVPGTVADIVVTLQGQVRDVLTLLDMKPLQYPTRLHMKPGDAAGSATITGEARVPTIKGVDMSKVALNVKAAVSGFVMPLGTQMRLSNGTVTMEVDNQHLHASGNIVLGRTPVSAEWTEIFNTNEDITSHVTIRGSFDEAARADLRFGIEDVLSGPANVVANIDGHRGTMRAAHITADLTPATITLEPVGYRKPPGTQATAQVNAQFDPKGDIAVAAISVSGSSLAAQGTLNFINGTMARADFPVLRAGANNDFAFSLVKTPPNGIDLSVKGASADGTGFSRNSGKSAAPAGKPQPTGPPLHVTARLGRVVLSGGAALSPFALDMTQSGDRVQSMLLNGGGKANAVTVSIARAGDSRKLTVTAANAGPLLQGVFGLGNITGGQMEIDAKLPPANTPAGRQPDYVGTLVMRDFRIENQPFFARLFSAGSLGGLVDLMRGEGIGIDKLTLPFSSTNDVIDIREAHASGPSVGLSAEGYIDRRNNTLDLQGAVAPIYGLNGMLNSIPLLGSLLTSKKGEGILGMTYEASGSLDEPKISVNPLSMLTPGIFRRIFEGKVPSAPAQIDTATQPAQKPH